MLKLGGYGRLNVTQGHRAHMTFHWTLTETIHLYFLKLLKRAGVPNPHLQHFYVAVIRPIMPPQFGAANYQIDQIEAIQKRAINIIHRPNCTYGMPYSNALFLAGFTSLTARREQLARNLFDSITQPRSCLHHLLPPPGDRELKI